MSEGKSSSRRGFLAGAAVAGALTGSLAGGRSLVAPAQAAGETFELRMVTAWPKGAPGVGVNAERFAAALGDLSGGRLKVRVFAAGELVPPFECLDAVATGTADLAHATPYYWASKSSALNFFTGVPFGMTAVEFASWLTFGGGQALWEEVYAPFGVTPFYAGSSGPQAGGWFNREILTLDDFRGLKFRIAGLGGEVLRRLGVVPVLTPPGEIGPALASGAVDGADWVGPWNDMAFGLYRFAKFYYMPGFHEPGPSLEVLVNSRVYESLPPDLREILRTAARAAALETLADFTYHNIVSFGPLVSEHGVQVRRFPDDVVVKLGEVSRAVLAELAAGDPLTMRVQESYMAFLAKARSYAPHADLGFLEMRELAG